MTLKAELAASIAELHSKIAAALDIASNDMQHIIDQLTAALELYTNTVNEICDRRDRLDEEEKDADLQLQTRITDAANAIAALQIQFGAEAKRAKHKPGTIEAALTNIVELKK